MKKRLLFLLLLPLLIAASCNKSQGYDDLTMNSNSSESNRPLTSIDLNENDTLMKKEHHLAEEFNNTMRKAAPKPHFWSWKSVKGRASSAASRLCEEERRSNPD